MSPLGSIGQPKRAYWLLKLGRQNPKFSYARKLVMNLNCIYMPARHVRISNFQTASSLVYSLSYSLYTLFLAYRIGESLDLPVHGKPYLSPHNSELLECLPTEYTGEEFRLSTQCMDDFRLSDVT